jgi:hypothetical protein
LTVRFRENCFVGWCISLEPTSVGQVVNEWFSQITIPGAAERGYTAAPVIEGDRLFACAGGTNGAGVVCVEKQTGKVLWRSQNDRASYAAPIIATMAGTKQLICFTD